MHCSIIYTAVDCSAQSSGEQIYSLFSFATEAVAMVETLYSIKRCRQIESLLTAAMGGPQPLIYEK